MPIAASICDQETGEPLAYVDTSDCLVATPGRAVPGGVVQFTGEAGYKRLALRIQALMPKPSEQITL